MIAVIKQTRMVATNTPSHARSLRGVEVIFLVRVRFTQAAIPLIAPPIAPPIIGKIEQSTGELPHAMTNTGMKTVRAISYQLRGAMS